MFRKIITYLKEHLRVTLLLGIIVLGIIVVALGYTYAMFTTHVERQGAFTLIVPELNYTVESSSLNEQKQITVGKGEKKTFSITVTNIDEVKSHFKLYYTGTESSDVKILYQNNKVYKDGLGTLDAKGTTTITITIENNASEDVMITLGAQGGLLNKELTLKEGQELEKSLEYKDESGANQPVLVQGQIPVVYDSEQLSWVKADTSSEWYNYSNQEWANAVTVTEANRETYMNAEAGTPVSMDDINTMWVWIPRYEYMYTNLGTSYAGGTASQPGEIKINFLNGKTTTPSDSANYKVHPAFTFGEDELEGLWYAKFETTGTLASTCSNEACNTPDITIKPGVASLRGQTVGSFFYMARSMQMNHANTFGFSKTDSNLHMSKNVEWGAVSYLSQSKYGKYGNPEYGIAEKEVQLNSNANFITGGGSGDSYTTNISQSTTGNITGIYDMSGGSAEYVMGYLTTASSTWGSTSGGNFSGFTSKPDDKYFDGYTTTTVTTACNDKVCYGQALSETLSWYGDYNMFVSVRYPWLLRSGIYNDTTSGGLFYMYLTEGRDTRNYYSTRLVLVDINGNTF